MELDPQKTFEQLDIQDGATIVETLGDRTEEIEEIRNVWMCTVRSVIEYHQKCESFTLVMLVYAFICGGISLLFWIISTLTSGGNGVDTLFIGVLLILLGLIAYRTHHAGKHINGYFPSHKNGEEVNSKPNENGRGERNKY